MFLNPTKRQSRAATLGTAAFVEIAAERPHAGYARELWRFRELLLYLAWRDLAVRYKQTVVGVLWAIIRPLITIAVMVVVFERLAKIRSDNAPYAILVFAGLLPWQLFSAILTNVSTCLQGNQNLISKAFFPRMVLPLATVLTALVDFAVGMLIFFGLMAVLGFQPSWRIVFLPLFVLASVVVALGVGLWVGSWSVRFRDFHHIVPFVLMIGTYLSPVAYPSSVVPSQWQFLYSLNPMAGVIDGIRWSLMEGQVMQWEAFAISIGVCLLVLVGGVRYFLLAEHRFADYL